MTSSTKNTPTPKTVKEENASLNGDSPREDLRWTFLIFSGWALADVNPLPSDASSRRYFRLTLGPKSAMLMDAPPQSEDTLTFVTIAEHLNRLGLSAPQILARDVGNGFLLLEDLGDGTFTRLLQKGTSEAALYEVATDTLIALHRSQQSAQISLPAYDSAAFIKEALLLVDWFYPALYGKPCAIQARDNYINIWHEIFDALPPTPQSLVLRDYHVDNLILLQGREGIRACGLLDFQDALLGPVAYDLVSLLEDARRDVSPSVQDQIIARYLNAFPDLNHEDFMKWYAVLGANRHAKVAGIFVRLFQRDGKPTYLRHIPRVVNLLESHLEKRELSPLKRWMDANLPDLSKPLDIKPL